MKILRFASATWSGPVPTGSGSMTLGRDGLKIPYSLKSRVEDGFGTNPEELIGAAHAGCFSMALTSLIGESGKAVGQITTTAKVTLEPRPEGYSITEVHLITRGMNQGVTNDEFIALATRAKQTCTVSRLFSSATITLDAALA
jgi:osmotically inducible protein OsmC